MTLMNTLALRYLRRNKKQTFPALLAIILAVSMLVAVSTLFFSVYLSSAEFAQANDLTDTMSSSMNGLVTLGVLLGLIISGAAVIVISNAFSIQAGERIKQFGILKSVGATETQIKSTITAESNWLSLIGIPAGVVLGHVFCFGAILMMQNYAGDGMTLTVRFNLIAVLLAMAVGFVAVRLASLLSAQKVSKLSAIEAIRQTDEINIKAGSLKTPAWIGNLFGFEGTLAAKQMKRNRRKFRITVLSAATSVVLFLGAFSFGNTLINTALGVFADTGADVVINAHGNASDFAAFDAYAIMLNAQNPKEIHTIYSYLYAPMDGQEWVVVLSMDDADYNAYCAQAGVTPGTKIYVDQGKDQSVPFDVSLRDDGNIQFSVTAKGPIADLYLKSLLFVSAPNVIVPRSELQSWGLPIEASYYILTEDAAGLITNVKPQSGKFGFEHVSHHNTEEYTRELQRVYAVLMSFVYCLIAMLALIGATSALTTINSSINLRKGMFATLLAVGMETKTLRKMLNLEGLLCGVKSLLYGLPIGLLLSYGMHRLAVDNNMRLTVQEAAKVAYVPPYWGILGCVVGVLALNYLSTAFAASDIRRSNIAETMRTLNA